MTGSPQVNLAFRIFLVVLRRRASPKEHSVFLPKVDTPETAASICWKSSQMRLHHSQIANERSTSLFSLSTLIHRRASDIAGHSTILDMWQGISVSSFFIFLFNFLVIRVLTCGGHYTNDRRDGGARYRRMKILISHCGAYDEKEEKSRWTFPRWLSVASLVGNLRFISKVCHAGI